MVMLIPDKMLKLPNNVFLIPKKKRCGHVFQVDPINGFVNKLGTVNLSSFVTWFPPHLVYNQQNEKKKVNKLLQLLHKARRKPAGQMTDTWGDLHVVDRSCQRVI